MQDEKIRMVTDQRSFTLIYDDFLESDLLNPYEKLIFIYLKKYADKKNQCFPSLNTLAKVAGISRRKVQDCLKNMQDKGVLEITHRNTGKEHISNLYTLYDTAEIWTKKELTPDADQSTDVNPQTDQHNNDIESESKYKSSKHENQAEMYTMQELHDIFNYADLTYQVDKEDLDSVFDVIYDTVNSTQKTIRVGGENRPTSVVVGRLMKLEDEDIKYIINKYNEQTGRIKRSNSYIRTLLYNAKGQNHLEMMNEGHYSGDF